MNYATITEWRDALMKIATEQLSDCEIKQNTYVGRISENEFDIYFPEQDHKDRPVIRIEIEPAGRLKRDRICIRKYYRPIRNYETDEQFSRNIAKIIEKVRADYAKAKEEERIKAERLQAEKERKETLEKIADTEVREAFSNHEIEDFYIKGDHRCGSVHMNFPRIKNENGFAWCRSIVLEYRANEANELSWIIGKDIFISDLVAFSKTIR